MSAAEHLRTLRGLIENQASGSAERIALEFAILAVIALDSTAPEQPVAQAEVDALGRPACNDCGTPYCGFGSDMTLPHAQWDSISKGAPLLCGTCICRRAEAMGAIAVRAVVEFPQSEQPAAQGDGSLFDVEFQNADLDDPEVERVARAIATDGVGREWDDFKEVDAFGLDQSDLLEYARAAIAALQRQPADADRVDAERYRWLKRGGWEVLQDPKYWRPELKFDGAVDAARIEVAIDAAIDSARAEGGGRVDSR